MDIRQRIKRQLLAAEPRSEYELQKRLSQYLNRYYPKVEYRVDLAGVNLSKAASGQMKYVNKRRAWPDHEIYDHSGVFCGLCMELKKLGTRLQMKSDSNVRAIVEYRKIRRVGKVAIREDKKRKKGDWSDRHIEEQFECMKKLIERGRCASFGVGLEKSLCILEGYLDNDLSLLAQGMHPKCLELITSSLGVK